MSQKKRTFAKKMEKKLNKLAETILQIRAGSQTTEYKTECKTVRLARELDTMLDAYCKADWQTIRETRAKYSDSEAIPELCRMFKLPYDDEYWHHSKGYRNEQWEGVMEWLNVRTAYLLNRPLWHEMCEQSEQEKKKYLREIELYGGEKEYCKE